MKKTFLFLSLLLSPYFFAPISSSAEVLFREDFKDLKNWKPLLFPKIKDHSKYEVIKEGSNDVLKAESNASASGLLYKNEFDVYKTPMLSWRWKVENILKKGDATKKEGDDYPIRVYIVFKYDPDRVGFGTRIKYNAAKLIYGEYPPAASLNYIWSSKNHAEAIITSPYADQAKMIPVSSGAENLNTWQDYRINILEDYRKAFGEDPPNIASIAIMSDTDNTKESARAFVDFIEVFR